MYCCVVIVLLISMSSCFNSNEKQLKHPLSCANPIPPEKMKPIILIREVNGKLKAYKGFAKGRCGNPIYAEKDSISAKNFMLIANPKELVIL